MMLVGVLLALFVLIALIVGTVFFYMGLRKKYMHRKILNEVLVIAIAMVLCLVLRLSVVISLGMPWCLSIRSTPSINSIGSSPF